MDDEGRASDLDVCCCFKGLLNSVQIGNEELLKFGIGDIASCYLQEPAGLLMQEMGYHEVGILAHDNPSLPVGQIRDHVIAGSIPIGKVERVPSFMTREDQCSAQRPGKLRIQQKPHAATGSRLFTRLMRAA